MDTCTLPLSRLALALHPTDSAALIFSRFADKRKADVRHRQVLHRYPYSTMASVILQIERIIIFIPRKFVYIHRLL